MKFLDKKEQVLDIQLTPYGEYLLSQGRFKPEYYSFYDDNILYESQYSGDSEESQSDIEPRIQENTPQLETQVIYSDRDIFIKKGLTELLPSVLNLTPFDDSPLCTQVDGEARLAMYGAVCPPWNPYHYTKEAHNEILGIITYHWCCSMPHPPEYSSAGEIEQVTGQITDTHFERYHYGPQHRLGRSDILKTDAPAWSVSMLRGEITGSIRAITGSNIPTINIPQLNSTLTYKIDILADSQFVSDSELATQYPNGEYLDVKPEIILAQVIERNAEFTKENFDIEVFEVTSGSFTSNALGGTIEELRPLKFKKPYSLVQDNILLDEKEITVSTAPLTNEYVEYYFDIKVDNNINEQLICSSISDLESRGLYVDTEIECEDTKNISLVNIYTTDAVSAPCPEDSDDGTGGDDPCEPETIY